jgi:hypothetical protein
MTSPFNLVTNEDGSQDLTIENVNLTFNNFDPTTGASSMTITASNGFSSLPAVAAGAPGQPTQWQLSLTPVAFGTALPEENPAVNVVSPGGPGEANVIAANFYLNQGAPGDVGSFLVSSADDVIDIGEGLLGDVLSIVGLDPIQFAPATPPLAGLFFPTTVNNTTSSSGEQRTLAEIAVPEFTFNWAPLIAGQCVIVPGDGTAQVNLVARLNNAETGQVVATGVGVAGQTTPIILSNGPPAGSAEGFGLVGPNTAATIYINAEQIGGTVGDFSTEAATTVGLSCGVLAVS